MAFKGEKNIHPQSKVRTLLCEQSVKCLAILTQKWAEICLFQAICGKYGKDFKHLIVRKPDSKVSYSFSG